MARVLRPAGFDEALRSLVEWKIAGAEQLVGCTPAEIAEVAASVGGRLPESYAHFLRRAGRGAGWFFGDSDFYYPELLSLRDMAAGLLRGAGLELKATELPFATHEGYQLLSFDAAAGDDPPVSRYLEGDPRPRVVAPSFSTWFIDTVCEELRCGTPPPGPFRRLLSGLGWS